MNDSAVEVWVLDDDEALQRAALVVRSRQSQIVRSRDVHFGGKTRHEDAALITLDAARRSRKIQSAVLDDVEPIVYIRRVGGPP